jgi:threonine-phosphate decarboxylase
MSRIEPYPVHGGQLRQIAEQYDVPVSQLLDFSANINSDGPPPAVISTLREGVDDPSTLVEYPDLQQTDLKRAISRYAEVNEQNVTVANGFVPLLEAAMRVLSTKHCRMPVPAFVEYRKALVRGGVEVSSLELSAKSGFRYLPEEIIAGSHDAILLANPQNPSGVCHDAATMCDLVARAAHKNMLVLVDEAFIDYVPEHSITRDIDRFHNLIVFRSVTKFHGIPGLRVAYAVSNSAISSSLAETLPPWPITTLAARGVVAALDDKPYAVRSRATNAERRNDVQHGLTALGLITYPSAANFILFQLPSGVELISFWERLIVKHHIVVRICTNYEALPGGYLRAAVRTQQENAGLQRRWPNLCHTVVHFRHVLMKSAYSSDFVTRFRLPIGTWNGYSEWASHGDPAE